MLHSDWSRYFVVVGLGWCVLRGWWAGVVGSARGNNRPLLPQANTLTVVPDCPDCRPLNLSDVHKYSNSKMGNTQITSLKFDSMAIIVDFKHMTGIKSTVHASGGLPTK